MSRRSFRLFLVTLFVVIVFSYIVWNDKAVGRPAVLGEDASKVYLVERVIDGDTVELATGEKVRYLGIDTPESVKPNTPPQCFSKDAYKENRDLVEGKYVRLETDISERDKYGRLLRYVYVDDLFVNEFLVKEGYAVSKWYKPNDKYKELIDAAQEYAVTADLGLWKFCE